MAPQAAPPKGDGRPRVAFVLGGGGQLGACQVGMLQALVEEGVRPDLVLGTSIGALNGVAIAARPSPEAVSRLRSIWLGMQARDLLGGTFLSGAARLVRTRTYLHTNQGLRRVIERALPVRRFDELEVPFQCVAASIERAAEQWFTEGPLVDAVLASAALPGVLPPVRIGDEHYIDGGIVNSIPVGRAVELGATEIYVLNVGRTERPLEPPRNLLQVAAVSFEVARRHRFAGDMTALPDGVTAHVLPTGAPDPLRYDSLGQLRYADLRAVPARIGRAHRATLEYLRGRGAG